MINQLKTAIDAGEELIPCLNSFISALKQVNIGQDDLKQQTSIKEEKAEETASSDKVVVYPSDLFRELGVKKVAYSSTIPSSYLTGYTSERLGLATGLAILASLLLELHSAYIDSQPAEVWCVNHNSTYNPTLLVIAVACADASEALKVRLENGLSQKAKDGIAVGLRHSVNNVRAKLQHIMEYEIFKTTADAPVFETKNMIISLTDVLIEDMKVLSKYTNILNGAG